jgi:hypothetical protein
MTTFCNSLSSRKDRYHQQCAGLFAPGRCQSRHRPPCRGDWGDVGPEDKAENELSLKAGFGCCRLLRPKRKEVLDHHRGGPQRHDGVIARRY